MNRVLRRPEVIINLFMSILFFLTVYLNIFPYTARVTFYPLYREIKKQNLISKNSNFVTMESPSFKIRYNDVDIEYVNLIKDSSELHVKNVLEDFDFQLNKKIDILIYSKYADMADKIGLASGNAAMGVYYCGTISVLNPSEWIEKNKDTASVFNREGPMVHEFTHYVIDYMTAGNVPVWFTEGIALYEEYRINNIEWAETKNYTDYYTLRELQDNFYSLDEMKAYKQSFLIVKYMAENFGMDNILKILKSLRWGKSMEQAVKDVLSINLQEIFKKACRDDYSLQTFLLIPAANS